MILLFFADPAIKKEGVIITPARCEEGSDKGIGEQLFCEQMRSLPSMHGLSKEMRRQGYEAGGQRAFVMAEAMELNPVVTVGAESSEIAFVGNSGYGCKRSDTVTP